jgi:hypothetical protein
MKLIQIIQTIHECRVAVFGYRLDVPVAFDTVPPETSFTLDPRPTVH